jgi:hypothetical protein
MRHGPFARQATRRCIIGTLVVWLAAAAGRASAQSGIVSRDEALAAVFPDATIALDLVYLTPEQVKRIAKLSRDKVRSRIYARYIATRDGVVVGRAYVDTHVVRTKRESLLVSLDVSGRVRRIDVTAFLEPAEYLAPEPWMRQYYEKPLSDDLAVQRAIRPIAGATLTVRAVNAAVRRLLALDQVLESKAEGRVSP